MFPQTPKALKDFTRSCFQISPATAPLLPGACSPCDYLVHSFFEGRCNGRDPGLLPAGVAAQCPADCVVWANRGGGKTLMGAVATMLDLMFKPGIQVRILAGSLQQAARMHEHLRRFCKNPVVASFRPTCTARSLVMLNGSRAEILAASETSIRGSRVAKLRCDEVDLFKPNLWEAAQLTTRSAPISGPWGGTVRGAVESLSTMHMPLGMMWSIVSGAAPVGSFGEENDGGRTGEHGVVPVPGVTRLAKASRVLFRWGMMDVLERCLPERDCGACVLWEDCEGKAKRVESELDTGGHISVDDAIAHKLRIPLLRWQSEALCLRPSRSDAVFPEFDERAHVFGDVAQPVRFLPVSGAAECGGGDAARLYAGMDFGFRSPTTVLWASLAPDGVLRVLDCYAEATRTMDKHIEAITERTARLTGGGVSLCHIAVDPAGHQRSAHSGISSVAMLRQAGLVVRSRPAAIDDGLQRIRMMLEQRQYAAGGADASGAEGLERNAAPQLLIHRRCTQLIEAMHRFHYPADKPHETSPVKDGNDHAIDALRYLVMSLPRPGEAARGRSYL